MSEEKTEIIGPKSKKQKMILSTQADTAIVGGAMGCVDSDTEFLSENGWVKISDFNNQKVAQYNPFTDSIDFVKPKNYIKLPCETLTQIKAKGIDQCLSDEHRVVYWPTKNSKIPSILPFSEIKNRHEKSLTKGWTGNFKTTFKSSSGGIDLTEGELRLQIAVMADGRIVKEGKDNYTQMRFSKERKYLRILDLCKKYNLKYKDNGSKVSDKYLNGLEYEVIVWPKWSDKKFDSKYYSCSQEQLEIIKDEICYWDGSIVANNRSTTFMYYSRHKEDADFVQYVFSCSGLNATIVQDRRQEKYTDTYYSVNGSTSGKGFRSLANKDGKAELKEYKTKDGFKYCFSVDTGMFVIRRNNKICITGNSGKSYIALLFPLRYKDDPHMRGIIFRKTTRELTAQGGLWETACELYSYVFGRENIKINIKELKITFPAGGSIKFSYMERDNNRFDHMGAQYTFILFDEATHFSQTVVEYLGLRMRSARAKHKKQMILTCNPDPDWFGLEWIRPYLHADGTPNQDMDGVIRYYVVKDNQYIWADDRKELEEKFGADEESGIKSFTFISANCYDNPVLLKNDPTYISTLKSKPHVDVQRYLYGNWFVRPSASGFFKREWLTELPQQPPYASFTKIVRAYDFAAVLPSDTNRNPDYTASVKMGKLRSGDYVILEVTRTRIRFGDWEQHILENAARDGNRVDIVIPQDPNAQAKANSTQLARTINDHDYHCTFKKSLKGKLEMFRPFSASSQIGVVQIVKDCGYDYYNKSFNTLSFYYNEMEGFTGERRNSESGHDDCVDATSLAYIYLASSLKLPKSNFLQGVSSARSDYKNPLTNIQGAI